MSKVDITLGRDMTINAGNYSSIKPSVVVTIHDIEENEVDVQYNRLSDLVDALLAKEILKMSDEMATIQESNLNLYHRTLKENVEQLDEEIRKFVDGKLYRL